MADIAFIVASAGSPHSDIDAPFYSRMDTTLGHTVTYISDEDTSGTDFSGYDVIVVSDSVVSSNVNGHIKSEAIPVLFMEAWIVDDEDLGTGQGSFSDNEFNIVDNTHYITQDESTGLLAVYSLSQPMTYGSGWSNDVNDLAQVDGQATQATILEIDKDETLVDSSTAAERRVYWGGYRGDYLNDAGWTLWDRALGWCLYEDAAADSGSADLSANLTIQKSAQSDLSVNTTIQNKSQADLSGSVTIQKRGQYDQSANVTIQNKGQYDLSSNATIQNRGHADLSSSATIQNKFQYDLSSSVTIQNVGQADQSANVTIQNRAQSDLSANFSIGAVVRSGQADLSANFTIATDAGYITLADALVHNIPISSQTHTIEVSSSIHNIAVSAVTHAIEVSDQTHKIVISSEPLK